LLAKASASASLCCLCLARAGTSPPSPRYSSATNSDALAFLLSSSAAFFINNFSPDAGLLLYVFQRKFAHQCETIGRSASDGVVVLF
jgi:hypothetical protein